MIFRRRLRGVAVSAAIWGAVFAATGVLVGVVLDILGQTQPLGFRLFMDVLARLAVRWGTIGLGMGALFAATIIVTQRSRTVADLSAPKFRLFGLAAGAAVSFVTSLLILLPTGRSLADSLAPGLIIAGVCGAIGASVAAFTLRLARRAEETVEPNAPAHTP